MRLRETYRLVPVILIFFLLFTGKNALAQQSLLDIEINLSRNAAPIEQLLKEIARKGKFSFTYTSQIQAERWASVFKTKQTVRDHLRDIFRYDSIQIIEQNNKILLAPVITKLPPVLNFKSVKGLVVDERSKHPLPYANIFLSNKSIGTISNSTGKFELKLTPDLYTDTISVSHIGYEVFTIPVKSLDSGALVIKLTAQKIQIREIIVKPLDPIYILTKAIERIPWNYDKKPALYTGFFRESTQQDNKNVSLSEAIINIFKEPYTSMRDDQVKIFKGRKGSNTGEKEFIEFIIQGGLYNTLKLDIVKNLPSFLDADYFPLYDYEVERTITHMNRLTYVIAFQQRQDVKYPCYKGHLYIDVETLAIVGASFEMPETGMNYAAGLYVKKIPRHTGVKPLNAQYQVFYRYYNNKWNLSNARSEVIVRVRRKKNKQQDKFNSVFASVSEFVITQKDTVNVVRFKTEEISRPRDVLEEQINNVDYEFWGEENIIIPDEPLEKTITKLRKRNSLVNSQEMNSVTIEEEKENQTINPDSIKGVDPQYNKSNNDSE